MRFKEILPFLNKMNDIIIYICDLYNKSISEQEPVEVFNGSVLDIPWIYMDCWLYNNPDYESINIDTVNKKFEIYLTENKII